ncbi:reverse transcriptase domain-containing protein [Tanacetum coccineum]
MSTMAKNVIAARADNRPPMLEKSQYNSWQSRMEHYIRGKEHGKDLFDSVINGPFKYGTVEVPEKIHEECDIRATNIVLQGLSPDVYTLVNHHTDAKEIWDIVKLLIEMVHHQSYQAPALHQQSPASFLQLDAGLVVPSFLPSDDPIACLNKAMAFISIAFASRYLPTNNKLRTSGARGNATGSGVNKNLETNTANQEKVVRCYNCQGEGHMARPCTKLKRPKNLEWFKEKMLLAQALEAEVVSDEEQMAFLADNKERIATGQDTQELTTTAIFETNDLDAFDSDYDEAPSASAVLMAKLSTYDLDVLSKTENEVVQDTTSSTQQDEMIMPVIEEMSNQVAKCNEVNKLNKTHDALSILNTEDTLKLAEESKLKMNAKQNDPIAKEKKVNIAPIDYDALNKLLDHFVKHFVPKKQLSAEQAFWLPILQTVSEKPTRGNIFEIEKKELFIENDRLLEYIICQDVMCIAMHADLDSKCGVPAHDDNLTYA